MLTRRQQQKQEQQQQQAHVEASVGHPHGAGLPEDVISNILDAAVLQMSTPRDDTTDDLQQLKAQMSMSRSSDLVALLLVCRKWRQQVQVHGAFLRFKRLDVLSAVSITNDWMHLVQVTRSKDYKRRKLPTSIHLEYPQPEHSPPLQLQPHAAGPLGEAPAAGPGLLRLQAQVLAKRSTAELASFPRSALLLQMDLSCTAAQAAAAATAAEGRDPSGVVGGASGVMTPQVIAAARSESSGRGEAGGAACSPGAEWRQLLLLLKTMCSDLVLLDMQYTAGLVLKVVISFTGEPLLGSSSGGKNGGISRQLEGGPGTESAAGARSLDSYRQVQGAVQQLVRELTSEYLAVEQGAEGGQPPAGSTSAAGGGRAAVLYLIPTVSRFTRRVPFRASGHQ